MDHREVRAGPSETEDVAHPGFPAGEGRPVEIAVDDNQARLRLCAVPAGEGVNHLRVKSGTFGSTL